MLVKSLTDCLEFNATGCLMYEDEETSDYHIIS